MCVYIWKFPKPNKLFIIIHYLIHYFIHLLNRYSYRFALFAKVRNASMMRQANERWAFQCEPARLGLLEVHRESWCRRGEGLRPVQVPLRTMSKDGFKQFPLLSLCSRHNRVKFRFKVSSNMSFETYYFHFRRRLNIFGICTEMFFKDDIPSLSVCLLSIFT